MPLLAGIKDLESKYQSGKRAIDVKNRWLALAVYAVSSSSEGTENKKDLDVKGVMPLKGIGREPPSVWRLFTEREVSKTVEL